MERNSVLFGFVVGAIVPVLGYVVIEAIFDVLTQAGIMGQPGAGAWRRDRTLALLALCTNLIPFNIFKRNRWDDSMRGVVFPTLIYVAFWMWQFGRHLF